MFERWPLMSIIRPTSWKNKFKIINQSFRLNVGDDFLKPGLWKYIIEYFQKNFFYFSKKTYMSTSSCSKIKFSTAVTKGHKYANFHQKFYCTQVVECLKTWSTQNQKLRYSKACEIFVGNWHTTWCQGHKKNHSVLRSTRCSIAI